MAILSTLKSRRLRSLKGETTQQVIVFQIQHEWFALPIFAVKKVVRRNDIQGGHNIAGTSLTVYDGKELLVLDIRQQIYSGSGSSFQSPPAPQPPEESSHQGFLLIIQSRQGDLVGIPIDSSPTVRKFPTSAINPLPASYATRINIQCISGLIVQADSQSILFLLNPDQLLQTQPLLPPTY